MLHLSDVALYRSHDMEELFLRLHSQGLGHEAVIEIMIALLGVMIAVLTLISGLVAVAVTVVAVFGYQTIRDEAAKRAEAMAKKIASRVAKATATRIANAVKQQMIDEGQASGLSEGQSEPPDSAGINERVDAMESPKPKRRKATNDSSLKRGRE